MAEEKTTEGSKIPYVMAYGVITKTLDKIIPAATPSRFTQDFLATKLAIKGGTAKAVIPFLKRTGLLNSDGTPTELYNQFRNDTLRGAASASAIRNGFVALYEMNEYVHELSDSDLKALIVQASGMAATSSTVKAVVGSFKALRAYADFEVATTGGAETVTSGTDTIQEAVPRHTTKLEEVPKASGKLDLQLGYTINLNLPATTDIAVYDAIFKSLKGHLLDQ